MPIPPSTYYSGPVSPQQLNSDMYTFDSTVNGANGILWHTHRPAVFQTVISPGTAYSPLSQQPIGVSGIGAYTVVDTSSLFGSGGDNPGTFAVIQFKNTVNGSSGSASTRAGQWLTWSFPFTGPVTTPPGGVGSYMIRNGSSFMNGVFQYGSTGHNNCTWYLDLIAAGDGTAYTWQHGFWWLTASTPTVLGNAADTTSGTCRDGWLWAGVSGGGGTVASIPSPQLTWGTVTSAALNSTIGSCFTYLNNPPMLRVSIASGQAIPNATNTTILWTNTPSVDSYSSWSTANSTYTAGLPGLYLFCPLITWGTATTATGTRRGGIRVVPGGTGAAQLYMGPTYAPSPVGPGTTGIGHTGWSVVRILSLDKGDVVNVYGYQNSTATLPISNVYSTRFMGVNMSPRAPSGSVFTYAVPDTSFRWQAGALSGTALTAALNQHLGQDIAFLMNRPYFTAYQTVAQTGFTTGSTFQKITFDTVGALPAGGNGDNYAGWSTANNWYTSQLAGWYLCIADLYCVPPISGTVGLLTAGFTVSSSGGIVPSSTPDIYQQITYPVATGGPPPGVTAIGLYYLLPGEHVNPVMAANSWGGTWGTFVQGGTETVHSQFSCFWVAE